MAKSRERSRVRLLGVTGRRRSDLLIGTALQATTLLVLALPAAAQPAPNARPVGGSVVAGSATISQSSTTTTIDQASAQAAINWQSFSVGAQQGVTFVQPSASAIALNRVTGPNPSQIAGRIDANGQIVIVNQAGVTFYKGAQVNAQGVIVNSANISDANFMAGKMVFDQPGGPNASVVNQGTITVKQAGLAALVAPRVANSGVINAQMGHVVLAGAKTATLDLYGDGLLSLDVSNQVTQAPVGPNGTVVPALVTNSGVINANGGTVQLTAAAADGVLRNLVQAGGKIAANSVGPKTGTVTIDGIGGSVTVTGLIGAVGQTVGTTGGQVAVNATGNVALAGTARVNASGYAGGGAVAIGTTLQRAIGGPGTVATRTAANVMVAKGATITANATGGGNGGRVAVLSANTTQMAGSIAAKGSGLTGNGGFAEVSGANLGLTGLVNVSAPDGKPGTILLDPTDLSIVGTASGSVDTDFVGSTLPFDGKDAVPPPSTVSTKIISEIGASSTVDIQAMGTIDVQAPITLAQSLTLQAGGNLTVELHAPISSGNNVVLQSGLITPTGMLTLNDAVSASGTVQLKAGTGGIALNGNITAGTLDLITSGGGVTESPSVSISALTLMSSQGVKGTVSLLGDANSIASVGNFTVTPAGPDVGNFQMTNTSSLGVSGLLTTPSGSIYLQTSSPAGIFVETSSGVAAPAGTAGFQTDQFGIGVGAANTSGFVTAATFELAPNGPKEVVLLGVANSTVLSLESLTNIFTNLARIGAVTQPGTKVPVTTAEAITVAGTFDMLDHSLELDAKGPIDGTDAPLINVATLSGSGGALVLTPPVSTNNSVATLGNITATSFSLNDGIPLTVTGTVSAGASVAISDVGLLTVAGVINAPSINLAGDSINIPGVVNGEGGDIALTANVGTISETGTLIAGLLTGTAIGAADLLGANSYANQVQVLGVHIISFPDAGSFEASSVALRDGVGLTVGGLVEATSPTGQVFLSSTAPAGITIGTFGAVQANASTGLASLQTDQLINTGTVTAGTIELAPATAGGTVTLGAAGPDLSLVSMAGLTYNNLIIGAVTEPGGGAPVVSAGGIAIAGAFTFAATGSLTLDAASSTGGGATGAVTQSAPLNDLTVLSGTADSYTVTNAGNIIGALVNLTATTRDLDVESGAELFAANVSALTGNVYLTSLPSGGVALEGPVSAAGRVGISANSFALEGGSVFANTFELAPFSTGLVITLSSTTSSGLSLQSLSGISAGTVRLGAVTPPGGVAPVTSAGAITVAGTFSAAGATTLELDAINAISQSAPLVNVPTLAAIGGSVVLTNTGNLIGASSGIAATAGNIVLVDGESLGLNGSYSGNDLFFEVALKGGNLTIGGGGPASLSAASGGSLSLVADGLTASTTGSIGNAGGTVELAPFSSIDVSLAGTSVTGGMLISSTLLSNISVGGGTLVVGGYTNLPAGSSVFVPTAGAISLDGAVNLGGRAGTLVLLANGAVTERGGPLTVGTVTGTSTGDFSLGNPANQIQAGTGITATKGDIVLVDGESLTLNGGYSGNNLFFEVAAAGGTLSIGGVAPATLTAAPGALIALVGDIIVINTAGTITNLGGTVEIAPFSLLNLTLGGSGAGTQFAHIDVGAGTLVVGGYTNLPAGGTSLITTAGSITLTGALDLTGTAGTIEFLANGAVAEPGGPLTVANLSGASAGNFSLTNPANAIGQSLGITSSGGDVVLVNGTNLALTGAQTGNNLFFEVAVKGGTLSVGTAGDETGSPAQLTAATGGRISLVADQLTETANSSVTAPSGTLELAPFSPLKVSLFGTSAPDQFLVDPTMLSIVTPGLATLVVGGFTNEPAGATSATPSASSLSVDGTVTLAPFALGLNLLATGAITQAAPLLNVGTLAATGGSVVLANTGNLIANGAGIIATAGDIVLVDGESLTLNGSYSGNNLFFEVAAAGGTLSIGGVAPATLTAASGALIALVGDIIVINTAGTITNLGGTVEIAPFSSLNLTLGGSGGGTQFAHIDVGDGTLVVGGYTNLPAGGTSLITTAGSITLTGALDLTGTAGTIEFLANGAVTEPGGPLTAGTVTGVAAGDFSLSNPANVIGASTGITSLNGSVILVDNPTLQLTGTYSGGGLFFQVTQPGGSLALGDATAPATLLATGGISLVADRMTATASSAITAGAGFGTLEVAPFSAINESVAGTNGSGQLLVDATLLGDITGGSHALNLLVIGGYTPLVDGTTRFAAISPHPSASASGVSIDGALNLTTQATNLELLANGPVTEPGGPVTVPIVLGSSVGNFALTNPANAIAQTAGITAQGGDLALVDSVSLALIGQHSGNNLFVEVATPGGTLAIGGTMVSTLYDVEFPNPPTLLTAALGHRISLVADHMTEAVSPFGASAVTVTGGTVELAPFSAINTSLLGSATTGQLTIDATLLSFLAPGMAALRIGGYTNEPAGATSVTASAASITVDGAVSVGAIANTLNLQAVGGVTQSSPILNVATLTGTTGSTTLTNPNNTVATLGNYTASNGFALANATNLVIAGTITAGPSANFSVNGTLTETGGITANQLSGSAIGNASLNGNNAVAELDGFVVTGAASSLSFTPNGNLLIAGTVSASQIEVSVPGGNLTIGGTVSASQIEVSVPGGNLTIGGTVSASQIEMQATGGNVTISGTLSGEQIAVLAPSDTITLDDGASIVTGGEIRPTGTILPTLSLPGDGAPGAYLMAADIDQIGHSSVTGFGGGPSTLRLVVSGNVQFDPLAGLQATGTWLDLELLTGTATGKVFVKALDLSYAPSAGATVGGTIAALGSANLFGSVAGASGPMAAGLAFAHPAPNKNYLFNNCEIGSAACLLSGQQIIQILSRIQTETAIFVPATSLLSLVTPPLLLEPDDSDNLLQMPVVSKEDY